MPVAAVAGGLGLYAAYDNRKQAKDANKTAKKQRAESKKFIEDSIKQSRGDLFKLYPAAQESRRRGYEAGLDVLRESLPQQLGAFRGGNIAAQEQLIQGLPQIGNAIMGNPIDLSSFQPRTIQGNLTVPTLPDAVRIDQLGLLSSPAPKTELTEAEIGLLNNFNSF